MNKQMILRMPNYYKNFKCTAEKCSDNCCIGWEIDIDKNSLEHYKAVNGQFGKRLSENISESSVPHFILGKEERCPFLNDKNLCDIFINLGEDKLCHICKNHPRFYEWYDCIKEGGIGLCCEEAARLIITDNSDFSYYDIPTVYESCRNYDSEFYNYLFTIREKIISHLQNKKIPLAERLNNILYYAYNMQNKYDNFEFEINSVNHASFAEEKLIIKDILKELSNLELLGTGNLFKATYEADDSIFCTFFLNEKSFENVAVYFIWRHFLKSVYEDEFYSKIAFSVLSTIVIAVLCTNGGHTFSTGKLISSSVYFSKEIEYNEVNLNKIFDNFYENDLFSISKISSLLKFF